MPVTEQDVRALTYLAKRLRTETHGAGKWDESGTHAKVTEMLGQNLAITIERVTRHAADPEARTPGAILRPFTPPAATATTQPEHIEPVDRCSVCSLHRDKCRQMPMGDHDFQPGLGKPDLPVADIVQQLRQHIACEERPEPAPEPEVAPDPNVARLRAAKTTPEPELIEETA